MVWGVGSIALTLILTLPLTPILTLNLILILKMYIYMTPLESVWIQIDIHEINLHKLFRGKVQEKP